MQEWRRRVSQEEGHATQVIQLKGYRPLYPEISATVKEKFCHNVNMWDPLEGLSSVLSKHNKPGTVKTFRSNRDMSDKFMMLAESSSCVNSNMYKIYKTLWKKVFDFKINSIWHREGSPDLKHCKIKCFAFLFGEWKVVISVSFSRWNNVKVFCNACAFNGCTCVCVRERRRRIKMSLRLLTFLLVIFS